MTRELNIQTIRDLAAKIGTDRESLLPLLEELNREFHFLDDAVINEVSKIFGLSQTEVYSVASFYHLINVEPVGKYVIHLCKTIACDLKGKSRIVKALEAELGISMGETTEDRKFTLAYANCMGMCDCGPAMLINDDLYNNLTPSKAVEIIHTYQ